MSPRRWILSVFVVAAGFLAANAETASLEQLRVEHKRRSEEAARVPDAAGWGKLAEWIREQQGVAPPDQALRLALQQWLDCAQAEGVGAELKALAPDDRAGLLALANRPGADGMVEHRICEALAEYLRKHPQDDQIYERGLRSLKGGGRFPMHYAKSDGLLALAERTQSAESYYATGQWHERIPENECSQAPIRALLCYVRAVRLEPTEARHREALAQWLDRNVPRQLGRTALNQTVPPDRGLIPPIYPREPIKWILRSKAEDTERNGKCFKVEIDGKASYLTDAPLRLEGYSRVWELCSARSLDPPAAPGGSHAGSSGHASKVVDDTLRWAPLQWDGETAEWVAYPRVVDHSRLKRNLDVLQEELQRIKHRIPDLESRLKLSLQPQDLAERALKEIRGGASVRDVNAFYQQVLEERRRDRRDLEMLLAYRASVQPFQDKIEELKAELVALGERDRQRPVSAAARASEALHTYRMPLVAVAVLAGVAAGGAWLLRKKRQRKPAGKTVETAPATAVPAETKPAKAKSAIAAPAAPEAAPQQQTSF